MDLFKLSYKKEDVPGELELVFDPVLEINDEPVNSLNQNNKLLTPDLGEYLVKKGHNTPFKLCSFSCFTLGEDQILGSLISGSTAGCCFSKVENYPLPIIEQPMIFSIYLGFGSLFRANKISQKFRTEGLVVKVSPAKRYKTASTSEWVTPLQYLKNFS